MRKTEKILNKHVAKQEHERVSNNLNKHFYKGRSHQNRNKNIKQINKNTIYFVIYVHKRLHIIENKGARLGIDKDSGVWENISIQKAETVAKKFRKKKYK